MKKESKPPGGRSKARRANNHGVPSVSAENFNKKDHEQEAAPANDDFEARQKELWRWAAERLPPWGNPEKDDYDFSSSRSWTEGANEELLNAGCLYEYARESHKFRCLLVLNNRKREERSGLLTCIEYEGNSAGDVHLITSGWHRWLGDFAEELIANKSFAELLRTSRNKVESSLDALATYNRYPKAVELPGRYINVPGMQEVVIQIDWRHYDNKEIGAEMARWAANNRPESEPAPDRTGKKRESKVRSDLKALSVMRIWKHERKPWKRLKLVARVCRFKSCEEYEWPMNNAAKAEMTRARKRALNFFQYLFPSGKPSNY
jgi:hypothetical protein